MDDRHADAAADLDPLLTSQQVLALIPVSGRQLQRLSQTEPDLRPVIVGARSVFFRKSGVQRYIASLPVRAA